MLKVATGIVRDARGRVLLQRRRAEQSYAGYWEFPGGKVEANESVADGLRRELAEEIGIRVVAAHRWVLRRWQYAHGRIVLYVYCVAQWTGRARGREGQETMWADTAAAMPADLLPASHKLWKWLALPPLQVITAAQEFGTDAVLRALPKVAAGGALVQLRDKTLPADEREQLAAAIAAHGHLFMVNDDDALAKKYNAGLHLSAARLMASSTRPPFEWVGASCHDHEEIQKAVDLDLDYAVVSPVKKTASHPDAKPMGWQAFAELMPELPVYALGGLTAQDLPTAHSHGAHGIAQLHPPWQ